jgi:AGZA family xanthine/uracil permease-like MFS transporter
MQFDWGGLSNGDAWVALATFLYLDFLDATGTLFTMARLINENVPGQCHHKFVAVQQT